MFQTTVVEKIKAKISCLVTLFSKILPFMVCNALVAGGRRSDARQQGMREAARAVSLIPDA